MRFEFEVHGDKLVSRRLLRLAGNITDFSPAFEQIADDLRESERDLFNTEGASTGRPWAPLKKHTLDAKLARHQDPRILHREGDLERSLTGGHAGTAADNQVVVITPSALAFGSSLPYAGAHQRGTDRLPKRRPLDLAERHRQQMVKRLQHHAMVGVR